MTAAEFEEFLHKQIPITKAMKFNVVEYSKKKISLSAKLNANINHKSTAFGGSINSLVTVCGWAMVYAHIKEVDPSAHIVIQKSSINYLAPINHDFTAECILEEDEAKEKFIEMYKKRGKSRLELKVLCYDNDKLTASYEGTYVAFK